MEFIVMVMFAVAISADGFMVGLSYGLNKIRIPLTSLLVIALASCIAVTTSMLVGQGLLIYLQPRGAANQVMTLIDGYKITGDKDYLNTARQTFEIWWDHFRQTRTKFTMRFFQVGFLLEAFIDYYEVSGDERVVEFIRQGVEWMRTNRPEDKFPNMSLAIGFLASKLKNPQYSELQKEYLAAWKGILGNPFYGGGPEESATQPTAKERDRLRLVDLERQQRFRLDHLGHLFLGHHLVGATERTLGGDHVGIHGVDRSTAFALDRALVVAIACFMGFGDHFL